MSSVDKLIDFIESCIKYADQGRFRVGQMEDGRSLFVDDTLRIMVFVGTNKIEVKKYNPTTGAYMAGTTIEWNNLTFGQKQRIVDLMDCAIPLDTEAKDILGKILDGF